MVATCNFFGLFVPGSTLLFSAKNLQSSQLRQLPEFTVETALAEDAAESEVALALRRNLVNEHWAWGARDLFCRALTYDVIYLQSSTMGRTRALTSMPR